MNATARVCCRCHQAKAIEKFPWRERYKDRRCYHCAECARAATALYRSRNPGRVKVSKRDYHKKHREKINKRRGERAAKVAERRRSMLLPETGAKFCKGCGVIKDLSDFHRNINAQDGRAFRCMECANSTTREWFKSNRTYAITVTHRAKAARLGAPGFHTAEDIDQIRKRQGDKCIVCKVVLRRRGEVDHIVPISKGGSNWPSNLQLLCRTCNRSKHDRDWSVFARERGLLI